PLSHAPPPTARTEPAPLAREGQQVIETAALAPQPRHAVRQDPAREELAELLFHELRQPGALAALLRLAHERVQVLADHRVEHGVLGVPGPIQARGARPAPAFPASMPPASAQ